MGYKITKLVLPLTTKLKVRTILSKITNSSTWRYSLLINSTTSVHMEVLLNSLHLNGHTPAFTLLKLWTTVYGIKKPWYDKMLLNIAVTEMYNLVFSFVSVHYDILAYTKTEKIGIEPQPVRAMFLSTGSSLSTLMHFGRAKLFVPAPTSSPWDETYKGGGLVREAKEQLFDGHWRGRWARQASILATVGEDIYKTEGDRETSLRTYGLH